MASKKTGNDSAIKNFTTKEPAIDYAVDLAKKNKPSQLFIKDKKGKIQDERTYDNDPSKTPG